MLTPKKQRDSTRKQSGRCIGIDFVVVQKAVERLAVVLDVAAHLDIGRPLLLTAPFIERMNADLEIRTRLFYAVEFHHIHP
jgi:hypothetical protein